MRRRPVANSQHYQFKKGEFQWYRAMTAFHLGKVENFKLFEGDEVEFDGFTLRIGNEEHPGGTLRGAIRAGWLVPLDEYAGEEYRPRPAGVVMTPADPSKAQQSRVVSGAVISNDERIVGSHQEVRKAAAASARVVTVDDGVTVGRVNVPASFNNKVENSHSVGVHVQNIGRMQEADRRASFTQVRPPVADRDLTEGMTAEEIEAWQITQENRRLAAEEAEAMRQSRRAEVNSGRVGIAEYSKEEAARAQTKLSQEIRDRSAGGVVFDDSDPISASRAMEALDNPTPPPEVPAPAPKPTTDIVRTSLGIDWDKANPEHWASRAKEATDRFGWSKDILLSIAEVETNAVAKRIHQFVTKTFGQ